MPIQSRTLIRFSLAAAAAALLVACKTTPPPTAPVQTAPPPPPIQQRETPPTPPAYVPPRAQPQVQQPPPPPPSSFGPGSTQDFVVNVGDRVYFDFDSYSVRADAKPILDAQAAWLGRYPAVMVRIEGNADERGTQEYNFALGERRANSVRDYLVSKGVAASRITVVSYGKERPIDAGSTEEAWAKNRNGHTTITSGAR